MNFLRQALEVLNPVIPDPAPASIVSDGGMVGYGTRDAIFSEAMERLNSGFEQMERIEILDLLEEMSREGAVADKALTKLCQDATSNEVRIDAPSRIKKQIDDFLKHLRYQDLREDFLYMMLRDGDEFLQLEYIKSSRPKKEAFINRIMKMPTRTMFRNTNARDEFDQPTRAFYQTDDVQNGLFAWKKIPFSWPKIIHARNDKEKSRFYRYGCSAWSPGIKIFNMFMMLLEDAAIARHVNASPLRHHKVGVGGTVRTGDMIIQDYQESVEEQLTSQTTDIFTAGNNEIDVIGGTKNIVTGVDDIAMVLSILSIAIDYPIDLLSGMIQKATGGEELFRKEVVLRRTVNSIIRKENQEILKPLIDRELMLSGSYKKDVYRITSIPSFFEDENKKSKRGLAEVAALLKSPESFHKENNNEISWEEEQRRIEEGAKYFQELANKYPEGLAAMLGSIGRKDPQAGNQGDSKDTSDQQVRKTPGTYGVEDRND